MKQPDINERYAEDVIGTKPELIDAIEVQGVRQNGEECEVCNTDPDFYSVYLHYVEGGVQCCADIGQVKDAREYANSLHLKHGWPVYDYTNPDAA